jgi:hypothetical protein
METCEPDRIAKQKVARHLRKQAAAEEVRASQAVDLDFDGQRRRGILNLMLRILGENR